MNFWTKDKDKVYAVSIPKNLKCVYQKGIGLSIFANTSFERGAVLARLRGKPVHFSKASGEAVQWSEDFFIDSRRYVFEDFINHSCDPNTFIDFKKKLFVALRPIRKNEEVTVNYLTTEYDMEKMGASFTCVCGSSACFKKIKGFRYISKDRQIQLRPNLSPFLLKKLKGV